MGELFTPTHLIAVLAVALLLFGPKKLPELGKGLGDGIRSFRDGMRNATATPPAAPAQPAAPEAEPKPQA